MRVDATLSALTSAAANATSPAPGDLSLSFEELLEEGVTLEVQRQERAFGFSELGVIRPGPADTRPQTPAMVQSTLGVAPEDVQATAQFGEAERSEPVTLPVVSLPAESRIDASIAGRGFSEANTAASRVMPSPQQTVVAVPQAPIVKPQRQSPTSSPKTPSRPLPQNAQSRRFSIVVSEQEGAVQIIAGAPQLSAEAKERLRKAAAMLAAEFGVTLGDFTINGALVDAPVPTTGAPDGDFPG